MFGPELERVGAVVRRCGPRFGQPGLDRIGGPVDADERGLRQPRDRLAGEVARARQRSAARKREDRLAATRVLCAASRGAAAPLSVVRRLQHRLASVAAGLRLGEVNHQITKMAIPSAAAMPKAR